MAGTLPLIDLSRGLRRWWTKEGGLQEKINGIITFSNLLSAEIATLVAGVITNELVFSVNNQTEADNAVITTAAQVQHLAMTASGKSYTFPDMTANGYEGLQIIVKNAGAEAFGLKDNSGAYLVTSLAAGQFALLSLVDNGTAAGTWQAIALPPLVELSGLAANDFLQYDGSKLVNKTPSQVVSALGLVIGTNVQAYDAATLKSNATANLTKGYTTTSYDNGTKSTGTLTPDPANGHIQHATNGGAHTLAPPANPCSVVLEYTNNGSAGAITTSGFTFVDGVFDTTNGNKFHCHIVKTNSYSHLTILGLQ